MSFTFLCLVTLLFGAFPTSVSPVYNKDVVCIIDRGGYPVCETRLPPERRFNILKNVPIYDPYIPRRNPIFYECDKLECKPIIIHSITQVTPPGALFNSCYVQLKEFTCETIRFNYLKNIDKLLFLSNTIPIKSFYLVDCLLYEDKTRVCHKKDDSYSHARLVDIGTIVRQDKNNILSQDEFICEESREKEIKCDLIPYVPYDDTLKRKDDVDKGKEVLLKTGNLAVLMKYECIKSWCGYTGRVEKTRRSLFSRERYDPPGGKVYRCYYANKQQICKRLYSDEYKYSGLDWVN